MVSVRLGRKRRAHQTGLAERRLGLIFFAPHGSSWHIATNSKCAASVNFTSGLGAIAASADSRLLPPPTLRERRHHGFARRLVAMRRRAIFWCPKASVHIHGSPTGDAAALKMRPTTMPSASTSQSSSRHSPEVRLADARLGINNK
jgi:hypothetical protein